MMSRMLGAPLGGTTRGGHQTVESLALSLITPPNGGGGAGSCFGLTVVVALGEPNSPVTTCEEAALPPANKLETASATKATFRRPAVNFIRSFPAACSLPPACFSPRPSIRVATFFVLSADSGRITRPRKQSPSGSELGRPFVPLKNLVIPRCCWPER